MHYLESHFIKFSCFSSKSERDSKKKCEPSRIPGADVPIDSLIECGLRRQAYSTDQARIVVLEEFLSVLSIRLVVGLDLKTWFRIFLGIERFWPETGH